MNLKILLQITTANMMIPTYACKDLGKSFFRRDLVCHFDILDTKT